MTSFSDNNHTRHFVAWLGARINGCAELDFVHAPGRSFSTLKAAREAYKWPPRQKSISTPEGKLNLEAMADLAENQRVLNKLCQGLRRCLADPVPDEAILADWVQSILVWGGVYTRHRNGGGNAGWLDARRQATDLADNLRDALRALRSGAIRFDHGPVGLRSNAGLTKVYSLALENFVIYDSRVAAALAWLVTRWSRAADVEIPEHLKFACMRANEGSPKGKPPGSAKIRSPDTVNFPYFAPSARSSGHWRHAVWNQRANHVLTAALDHARDSHSSASDMLSFQSVRDVEAALFVLGADLRYSL